MTGRRALIYGIAFAVASAGLALTLAARTIGQRDDAARAKDDLAETRRLAERVRVLRAAPAVAAGDGAADVSEAINAALTTAGIPRDQMLPGVAETSPSRVGRTPYDRRPGRVTLVQVTPAQAIDFAVQLAAGEGVTLDGLRLTAPPESEETDVAWTAEVDFARLVHDPTPGTRGRRP